MCGARARKAISELVSCPFRAGLWAAGSVFAPRTSRLATPTLAALAAADFLQFARVAAQHAAEETP
ncbi:MULTISPECIES: DUF1360 domain-containing protein [Kitasatospora]|uniref:Uncharacterized protein n=1 Tax=Kitasatospora cystarginea TaxID=58350 RepID=A0ABN3EY19_9ACTN